MNRKYLFEELKKISGKSMFFEAKKHQLSLDFTGSLIPQGGYDAFQYWTDQLHLVRDFCSSFQENNLNCFERRSVNHHQLRSTKTSFYSEQHKRLMSFVDDVHNCKVSSLKDVTDVVQIGIGGSALGPNALCNALKMSLMAQAKQPLLKFHFISNVDPLDFMSVIEAVDIRKTLFVFVSKSGNTMEMVSNLRLLQELWVSQGYELDDFRDYCVVITSQGSLLDSDSVSKYRFYIDDAIGGRFSVTSPVGTCILGLCFGIPAVEQFLEGAYLMDQNAIESSCDQNLSLIAAWELVWQRTVCMYPVRVCASYTSMLKLLPNYITQLTCESNGKSVDRSRQFAAYPTSPLIVPAIGTSDQHSFFQLLHQGTDIIPVEFIGIGQQEYDTKLKNEAVLKLQSSMKGQVQALMDGLVSDDPNKAFSGKRPVSIVMLSFCSPHTLGQLIAFYENKTMYEGFIWDINSFDQEGVQLGKQMMTDILNASRNQ